MNVIVAPSIVGLAVQMPSPCRCGSRLATVAADHVLKCECGARRNPLSERTIDFITEIARCFGAPDRPIFLRRKRE
jgi:hypothetical protein